jgi:hypothetical protein
LHATIFLGLLAHPLKVWGAADLGCNGRDRARLCFVQTLMLSDRPAAIQCWFSQMSD